MFLSFSRFPRTYSRILATPMRTRTLSIQSKGAQEIWHVSDKDKENAKRAHRVTVLGVAINVVIGFAKLGAGIAGRSTALVADAAHSFGDLATDLVTLWVIKIARRPPNERFPFGIHACLGSASCLPCSGHGKWEPLGALFSSTVLIGTGLAIAQHSVNLAISASDTLLAEELGPAPVAAAAAVASIVCKEALFWVTLRAGTAFNSKAVIANAWHHRSDAMSSVVALVGVGGALLGYTWMDGAAGLLVSGMIVHMGVGILRDSLHDLTDAGVAGAPLEAARRAVFETAGVLSFHDLRMRRVGPYMSVDVHILVDSYISVSAAHQVAERVRLACLAADEHVTEVLVHVDPELDTDKESLRAVEHSRLMRPHGDIERDVRAAFEQSVANPVASISAVHVHFVKELLTVEVEATIALSPSSSITLLEAAEVARIAERDILNMVPDVHRARVLFALGDDDGHQRTNEN